MNIGSMQDFGRVRGGLLVVVALLIPHGLSSSVALFLPGLREAAGIHGLGLVLLVVTAAGNLSGIDAPIIVGIQTEYCVDTTVRVAFELGYTVFRPEMTNTTFDNGSVSAQKIYEMFNNRIFADRFASVIPVEDVLQALG